MLITAEVVGELLLQGNRRAPTSSARSTGHPGTEVDTLLLGLIDQPPGQYRPGTDPPIEAAEI